MRSFQTAVREKQAEEEGDEFPYEFELDGRTVRFRSPSSGEGTLLTMALARHNKFETKLASSLDIFFLVIEPDAREWLSGRLLDLDDGFDGMSLIGDDEERGEGILYAMIEEWSGKDSRSSTSSSSRSQGAGTGSRPRTRKSTSSASRSTSS